MSLPGKRAPRKAAPPRLAPDDDADAQALLPAGLQLGGRAVESRDCNGDGSTPTATPSKVLLPIPRRSRPADRRH